MLEGYVRISDAEALSNTTAPLPHELPLDMDEFLPADEDSYESRMMLKALTVRPTVDIAHTVLGWDRFLSNDPFTSSATRTTSESGRSSKVCTRVN